jgi:hypothetical protein
MTRKISDHLHTTLAHEGKKELPGKKSQKFKKKLNLNKNKKIYPLNHSYLTQKKIPFRPLQSTPKKEKEKKKE